MANRSVVAQAFDRGRRLNMEQTRAVLGSQRGQVACGANAPA